MGAAETITIALPTTADPALEILQRLRAKGHAALLAGGCVRDLLLGRNPEDFDIATDAPPETIRRLFRRTRHVGAQFGVVLVLVRERWVEVATFRSEGPYLDGRRPSRIAFADDQADARRRDFTINGMFYDPLSGRVIDYVGGRHDLAARLIRAIGVPDERFQEDHLRLLRAVRFAARLGFAIEPDTQAAIRAHAPRLSRVAAERIRDELFRMWSHESRTAALRWLVELELLPQVLPDVMPEAVPNDVPDGRAESVAVELLCGRLELAAAATGPPLDAELWFCVVLALLLGRRPPAAVEDCGRRLTCTNEERAMTGWLVRHQADLDNPAAISKAALKRLMAARAFPALLRLAKARFAELPDGERRHTALDMRLAAIPPEAVQPPPYITGDDLAACGLPPGPIYREILDELYTRQLDEQLDSRESALAALEERLQRRPG